MENVKLDLDENGRGHFYINENNEQVAEMIIGVSGNHLTVYHTEVLPKAEGIGLAKQLLKEMVDYARDKNFKIIPLCLYVFAQLKGTPMNTGIFGRMRKRQIRE